METLTASTSPALMVDLAMRAYNDRNWGVLAGIILMLVVVGLRFIGLDKLDEKSKWWTRWMTMGLAMATSIGLGLTQGLAWHTILGGGVSVGLIAIGGWEVLGKMVRDLWNRVRGKKES